MHISPRLAGSASQRSGFLTGTTTTDPIDGTSHTFNDLLRRAMETGMEIGLLRKVDPDLAAAAMLGMIRGVIEQLIRDPSPPAVEVVVAEVLMVALRGVLAS